MLKEDIAGQIAQSRLTELTQAAAVASTPARPLSRPMKAQQTLHIELLLPRIMVSSNENYNDFYVE